MHCLQLRNIAGTRRLGIVEEDTVFTLLGVTSLYHLAWKCISNGAPLAEVIRSSPREETLNYDEVYDGVSDWSLLPVYDHPDEPARCLVAGTGLTHTGSVTNRNAMHAKEKSSGNDPESITDSMRMFQWGLEGGKPAPEQIGVQPEWFYKGDGQVLRAHGESLTVPEYAEDGGEEPEIAGLYIIGPDSIPYRIGFTTANEFSDHVMERRNYLYLSHSKLRCCAIGPEAIVGEPLAASIPGEVSIVREKQTLWSASIATGEANMAHSISNLEHHHFKYPEHRRPGDAHIHFFGADAFSYGAGVRLQKGDIMQIRWQGMGRALRNPIRIETSSNQLIRTKVL